MNKQFWISAIKRAIHTMAQVALGFIGTGLVGIADVDWKHMLSVVFMACLVSILKSIVIGMPEVNNAYIKEDNVEEVEVVEENNGEEIK